MSSAAVTLGDVAGKLTMLDVACSKCDRRGRLSIAKLIAEHGADMRLPDLREILAGDCPRPAQHPLSIAAACIIRSRSAWKSAERICGNGLRDPPQNGQIIPVGERG